jgi:hypothetical protein
MKKVRLIIDIKLLRSFDEIPVYLTKTVVPLQPHFNACERTITELLSLIYVQFKKYFDCSVNPEKLYLTDIDGFFLPPNAFVVDCLSESDTIKITSSSSKITEAQTSLFAEVRKRDAKS